MPINVNKASREVLVALIGIGEEIADAIIALRPYSSIDDLISVPGIGRKILERLKEQGLSVVSAPEPFQGITQAEKLEAAGEHAFVTEGPEYAPPEESDQMVEGTIGRVEEIGQGQIYVEAPAGAAGTPQEVEGFNAAAVSEYKERRRNTQA